MLCADCFKHLLVMAPPSERSLVLLDPPCEPYELYMSWSLYLLKHLHENWPRCSVILWLLGLCKCVKMANIG